jgi:mannitol 2-dehydrogenase
MPQLRPTLDESVLHRNPSAYRRVTLPRYDRNKLVPTVVHIGVGGFHRAHQAVYFDDLAAQGEPCCGVVGVGLRRPQMGEVLTAQNGLFTVVERGPDGDRARIVASLLGYHYAPDDPEAVLRALADPRTRIVTLTVTGDGYLTDASGAFAYDHPDVRGDLADPTSPTTMVGFLVEALRRRRAAGAGPFTVLSCDNLPDSSAAARQAVLWFAQLRDPDLAAWIAASVTFPSSMVDRITPETSPAARDEVEEAFGVPDRWPVVTEPYRQWVIEDDFCAGRPPLERVGVQFVPDIRPYKLIKARLLNGGHSALGYFGVLSGYATTHQAMGDLRLRATLDRLLADEVVPLLPEVAGIDLNAYRRTTLARFANPAVGDSLARLCRRGSTKMPSYVLPSLHQARAEGRPHRLLLLAVAAWLRYLRGTDLTGRPIEVEDPRAEELCALARAGEDDPRPLLRRRDIFGGLVDDDALVAELAATLAVLSREGFAAAATFTPEPTTARNGQVVA